MLCSVLDANITSNIVRLGSRSADERISPYSLETLEKVAGKSRLDRAFGRNYRALKEVEDEFERLIKKFLKISVDSDQIVQYLEVQYPEHYEHTVQPPPWISAIKIATSLEGNWQRVGQKGQSEAQDDTMYTYWRTCGDLDYLEFGQDPIPSLPPSQAHLPTTYHSNMFENLEALEIDIADTESAPDSEVEAEDLSPSQSLESNKSQAFLLFDLRNPEEFFVGHGYDGVPSVPSLDRELDVLLASGELWSMARSERERLHAYWIEQVRSNLHYNHLHEFERLRERHSDALQRYNEGKDEVRQVFLLLCRFTWECH